MTCTDAIREVFEGDPGLLTAKEVKSRVYQRHPDMPWQPQTIPAHLIGLSRNHPSSKHYPTQHKQAFLHWERGGKFRLWRPEDETEAPEIEVDGDGNEGPSLEELMEVGSVSTALSVERDLERSLLSNLGQLEPGLILYTKGGLSGQQFIAGEVGRIDILAVGSRNDLVVIELKAGRADDKVISQILRYMGWVQREIAASTAVRGIIVANDFSEDLKYAVVAAPTVKLKRYEIKFEFTDI